MADLTLDKQMLQDVLSKMVRPAARRKASSHVRESYAISERRAARVMWLHRSTKRNDEELRQRLRAPAVAYPRYGYRMLTDKLQKPERRVNHKRVYRLYREESLQLPKRRRKRIRSEKPSPLISAERINQRWSMDFTHDMLATGRRFRALAVLDNCARESLAIEPEFRSRELDRTPPSVFARRAEAFVQVSMGY